MAYTIKSPRKLIEVALPLDAINVASAREKSIRQGHPSTLHLWWARRPLAAARAVIFGQLVNDPGYQQGHGFKYGKNKKEAAVERKRLFKIIEDLVVWENTTNEVVLEAARAEIRRSWREMCELNKDHPNAAELFNPDKLPALHDPFAGGGAIPLEAQRLGLEAYASDLNPVAVLINKAMIEIPPKFSGSSPVGPVSLKKTGVGLDLRGEWPRASGLAEDVRRYGAWMAAEAHKRVGHLYPPINITVEMGRERPDLKPLVGQKLTVIAWLWARTVKSPNPAFSEVDVPLASTFILYSKEGKEAYVHPVVEGKQYRFIVKLGTPPQHAEDGTKAKGRGANFRCILSDSPISGDYIKSEAQSGRMGAKLLAVVAEGAKSRVYLSPTADMEVVARSEEPKWKPDVEFFQQALGFRVGNYGMTKWSDLFTQRQLIVLTTLSDLVHEVRQKTRAAAISAGMPDNNEGLESGGTGAAAYADAVSVYLAFAISKVANIGSSIASWMNDRGAFRETFARQAVPMVWDFVEANPFADAGGSLETALDKGAMSILAFPAKGEAHANQADAATQTITNGKVVSTDPPYYDNIGYADLSDFFYVWLRPTLRSVFPNLLATMTVPKAEELVATPFRHGGKDKAEEFFLTGMTQAMARLAHQAHPAAPITIYYAFKQSETDSESGTASTGWETFLEAVNRSGLQLTGTWPVRTEGAGRMRGQDSNALASSIVLVCRKRAPDAVTVSRREFLRELNAVLPEALDEMTKGSGDDRSPVAPVDLSQAIIGPGMAVFSKYSAVLEADGSPMSVHSALLLINRFLAEDDFDPDTQFCLHWFEQYGWGQGRFGDADTLSRAKGTSVDGIRDAGVIESGGGFVRLRKWSEYPTVWNPQNDLRLPVWEALHQFIRTLKNEGETSAGGLLAAIKGKSEATRQLAYRLHTLCERQGWAEDARAYNELITSWTGIEVAASMVPTEKTQGSLFE
jgi:putative DNA methylase